jgi:Flp pilus assembly protein TadG
VTFTFTEAGVGLVTATAAIVETKAITGKVNLNNFRVTATATFNMLLLSMYPAQPKVPTITVPGIGTITLPTLPPLPKVNLVGKNCTTETPISVTMSGKVTIGATNTLSGVFTIPKFKSCALATAALNQLIPGPGNTFSATASPA